MFVCSLWLIVKDQMFTKLYHTKQTCVNALMILFSKVRKLLFFGLFSIKICRPSDFFKKKKNYFCCFMVQKVRLIFFTVSGKFFTAPKRVF